MPQQAMKNRYGYLPKLIQQQKCHTIMEIGTKSGRSARNMITAALQHTQNHDVFYYGFDLWEQMTEQLFHYEFSKWPPAKTIVEKELTKMGIQVQLYQGDTKQTLSAFRKTKYRTPDFIFIDGGHSIETIESDWHHISHIMGPKTIVIFDDYYVMHNKKQPQKGCNFTIDSLNQTKWNVQHLPHFDTFADRRIYFVQVEHR